MLRLSKLCMELDLGLQKQVLLCKTEVQSLYFGQRRHQRWTINLILYWIRRARIKKLLGSILRILGEDMEILSFFLDLIKVSLTLLFQSSSILCNIYIPGHEWYFGMPSHIYFCCSHGKKRERRESILRREFDMVLRIINKSIPAENHLRFLHWDLHENSLENL